jgi:nucleoid-associated protein YgaU
MSIFNFVKDAGEKIVSMIRGGKEDSALTEHVRKHELGNDDLKVERSNGKVTVTGSAASHEEREKIVIALGNVAGVESVDDRIIVTGATDIPAAEIYTVQKGDTLSSISKRAYGNANKYTRIFEANRPLLSHPDKIYPGQALRIPAKA